MRTPAAYICAMKKIFYAAFLFAALPASAQSIRIAPEVGLQMSNQTWKASASSGGINSDPVKIVGNVRPGLRAGVTIDAPLNRYFSIQPGVFYSQRGTDDLAGSLNIRVDYVEIPVNLLAKASMGRARLFIGGGPYLAIGVGGKISSGNFSQDVKFGDGSGSNFKRLDAGLGFNGGIQAANGVILRGFANIGLANIAPSGNSNNGIRNWGYGFSIGYMLR